MAFVHYGVSPTSTILRVKLMNSAVTSGAGITSLTNASSGLIISTIKIGEASATAYTVAASNVETITTLGTYQAPSANKCRFKEVDATNHPGMYEIQLADARFSSTDSFLLSISGATNLAQFDAVIQCKNIAVDMQTILGTTVSTPATAGILDVNVKNMNNVAATSITTINANIGQTQPINFTGTGSSAYVKSDMVDIAGATVSTTVAQLGVNTVNAGGTAWGSGAITDAVFASATYPKALRTATAQSGADGYIQLDASAGATDNTWFGCSIKITSGTGAGQSRTIILYVGSNQRAYVDRTWATNPASDSVFLINSGKVTADLITSGIAAAGAASTITLASTAVATANYYDGSIVTIISGTGLGQSRIISSYAANRVATLTEAWATTPDTTSIYIIKALGENNVGAIAGTTQTARDIGASVLLSPGTGTGQLDITSGVVKSNLVQVDGDATTGLHATGMVPSDIRDALGNAVTTTTNGILDVNTKNINNVSTSSVTTINANQGTTQPINFTGTGATAYVKSDMIDIASAAVSTSTAQIGVNVVSTNNIDFTALEKTSLNAATPASVTGSVGSVTGNVGGNVVGSVASVTGNVGGNVVGSVASVTNTVNANLTQILTTAVSTPATAGVLDVNVKNMNNVAATSITTINANQGTTQPINFTGTGVNALTKSDTVDIAGAAVSTSSAQVGVNVVTQNNIDFGALQKTSLNAATPASVTGAVGSVTGNVGGNVVGSVASVTGNVGGNVVGSVASVTGNVGGNVTGSVASVTNRVTANTDQISGSSTDATKLANSLNIVATCTVDDANFAPTSTEFETSSISDATANVYKDRSIYFTSGNLIRQAKSINASSLTGGKVHITTDAFTGAPANGDTFFIA